MPALRLLLFVVFGIADPMFAQAANVRAEICEQGLQDKDEWPAQSPKATESFDIDAFALDELPAKFVEDGVRGDRPSPSMLRLTGRTVLAPGKHRILLRSRSAARLSFNGVLLVETPFAPKNGGDGSQHDTERKDPLDLGAGFRFAPGGEYERIADYESAGGEVEVRLEAFVGGREAKNPRRVELGETVVAVSPAEVTKWTVLAPGGKGFLYTDAAWAGYHEALSERLAKRNAATRAALRAAKDSYWQQRRVDSAIWLQSTDQFADRVPAVPAGLPTGNPIDAFLAAKFAEVQSENRHASADAVDFFRDVKPLLEARCVDCHRGNKAKGGLRLDSLETALSGGDSGPALERGDAGASEIIRRVTSDDEDEVMPPKGARLNQAESALLARWINEGAAWPDLPLVRDRFAPPSDDLTFLRRVMLDAIGLPPTAQEARDFAASTAPGKRTKLIDRLLSDPRWADAWMPLWQDLLAENPNILNPTLNNTGPFRRWLYDVLADDLPVDRMVTQLVLQQGSPRGGGPAGFGLASQNDSPFGAKGTIISAAFLGVEMKCARCHDSPSGSAKQEQLFQLGAMLAAAPIDVPLTSSVDPVKLHAGGRKALIEVTLKPGSKVAPAWPFDEFVAPEAGLDAKYSREELAELLTSPRNERFAQVVVNRIWARFMGRGIVEPLDDWEKGKPTHPELLRWLAREFVLNGYQVKPVARLILTSAAYQRATDATLKSADPLYTAPEPRRLLAEQVVDSLFAVTGKPLQVEPLCLDLNGRRDIANSVDLGTPSRAWMLASLSNERDRPSLTLPRLQALTDVLSALGWRGARQDPASTREIAPNALQPAILANGTMTSWLTRLSDDHPLTLVARQAKSPEALMDELFLRILSRPANEAERVRYLPHLSEGFATRNLATPSIAPVVHRAPKFVTWTNHLLPEANSAKEALAIEAQRGDPPSAYLEAAWRQRCEDVIWALLNAPEVLYRP